MARVDYSVQGLAERGRREWREKESQCSTHTTHTACLPSPRARELMVVAGVEGGQEGRFFQMSEI